ncbi:MAG: molybdopterin molybdenumtransferase MoeA, partial [Pikeienuella sp.]
LRPAVDALLGLPASAPTRRVGRLTAAIGKNGPREHFMRAEARENGGQLDVTVFDNQDSSVLSLLAQANALAVQPPSDGGRGAGAEIDVILL